MMYDLSLQMLNLYQDCARCFWVQIHEKVKTPSGGAGQLPSGMNLAFKKYMDSYRPKGELPPELKGKIDGVLLSDDNLMKKWRDYKHGLQFDDQTIGAHLHGTLDECVMRKDENGDHVYVPLDFKTRGFEDIEENHDHHAQLKLDCYDLLLKKNGYRTSGTGYLVYYIPEQIRESGIVQFNVQVIQLVTDSQRAFNLVQQVVEVLNGKIPQAGQDCEYCAWGELGAKMMHPVS